MKTTMSINQLRDYSSLFSRRDAMKWLDGDFSSIKLKAERYGVDYSIDTWLGFLKSIYHKLEISYPNEYVVKNAFLTDWLIEELGSSKSKVFSEFRVGKAIADLVMFNGTSRAFEIKTEMDSDKRLDLQIENYRKAFNEIYLIVPDSKVALYAENDPEIGLIAFNTNSKKRFRLVRKAHTQTAIDANTIMHTLHTAEYKRIVKAYSGMLPDMNSFNQFQICKQLIKKIPLLKLNALFIEEMKKRNKENAFSQKQHSEFNQLSLALNLSRKQRQEMIQLLKSQINP